MAITFSALKYLREAEMPSTGDGGSERIAYVLKSNSSAVEDQLNDVRTWLDTPGNVPATLGGHLPADSSITELGEGAGYWQVTLTYSNTEADSNKQREDEVKAAGDNSWSFTISTNTQRYTWSKGLVSWTPTNPSLNDFQDDPYLLGVDSDNELQGMDVLVPEPSWEETHWKDPTDVTQSYRVTCLGLVGKVNNATFKGCAAKTVLLSSISGQQTGSPNYDNTSNLWQISYTFLYRPSETVNWTLVENATTDPPTFSYGNNVSKVGWEVYDIRYVRCKFQGATVDLPKRILVQKVYDEGDFSLLQIGT